jgi:hypothetical protein
MRKTVDLRPYTNLATFSIQETFPLSIAYKIFRAQVKYPQNTPHLGNILFSSPQKISPKFFRDKFTFPKKYFSQQILIELGVTTFICC